MIIILVLVMVELLTINLVLDQLFSHFFYNFTFTVIHIQFCIILNLLKIKETIPRVINHHGLFSFYLQYIVRTFNGTL